ncbi:adenylate/guanylate cyclase domain-containing protein [Actinoplanes sp. NPDC051343]|uniref:adenylate/guanylate cyclase domain-containing protein n=1 Tax=Actinoplanes sp. NPDC051343 TaxID=3363906 RepID=UPI00379E44FE
MSGRTELPSGLVTFMFTDIEGSTRLARMLGDSYGPVLGAHRTAVRAALSDFGGVEMFTEGDSFFVAFGNAESALAAGVAAQHRLSAHDWPAPDCRPKVRIGLHTGWAQPKNDEYTSTEVHRAARVAAAAHGGQILCSEATAKATTKPTTRTIAKAEELAFLDLGPHRLRGFDDDERLFQVLAPGLDREFPRPRTPAAPIHNLPAPLTPLIGRRAEIAELSGLLGRHRLVTVAGPGGAGKSRLALSVAQSMLSPNPEGAHTAGASREGAYREGAYREGASREGASREGASREGVYPEGASREGASREGANADGASHEGASRESSNLKGAYLEGAHLEGPYPEGESPESSNLKGAYPESPYPDGVWTVDAAAASTGLAPAMAAVLGLRTEPGRPVLETLLEQCASRRMLLLLETCEVVPGACAALVRRLLTACPGVDVLVTGRMPLGVPGEVVWRIPPLQPADAFELLDARVSASRGEQCGPADDRADLSSVAARLEGSPLAIEFAAARLRLLSAAQLAVRLGDPLTALDPPALDEYADADRHSSLTASLNWSHRTLSGAAAGLLRRLAVFAGPVELSTVEWCGPDALAALSELVDKSLVEVVPGPRYRMSEQVRAYANRHLATAGDEHEVRDRHVAWSLHTLDGVAVDTDGQPRTVSLTDLAPFVGEWQEALRWAATDGSARAGLRLADALVPWWREHGGVLEGRDLLSRLYHRLERDAVDGAEAARAYLAHAELVADQDERERFVERAERATDDPVLLVRALAARRLNLLEARRHEEAERLCQDVIVRAERIGVPEAALPAVVALAELLWRRDALDEAAELLGGARQLEASRPEDRGRRTVDWLLGMVALRRGDLVAAHDHLVVALRSRLRHGFRGAAADAVAAIAVRCSIGGDPATAAVLFGGAEAARGARRTEMFGKFWSAQQSALRSALGDATFDAAYADGVDLGFDRIVAMALAVEHPDLQDGALSGRLAGTAT